MTTFNNQNNKYFSAKINDILVTVAYSKDGIYECFGISYKNEAGKVVWDNNEFAIDELENACEYAAGEGLQKAIKRLNTTSKKQKSNRGAGYTYSIYD